MSASLRKQTCARLPGYVRLVPKADLRTAAKSTAIRSPRRRVAEKTKARRSPVLSQFSYSERVRTSSVVQRASQPASYPAGSCVREWRCAGICRVYRRHTKGDLPLARIDGLPRLLANDILMPVQQ